MKTPKMPGPSQAELDAQQLQQQETQRRTEQLDAEDRARKKKLEDTNTAMANRTIGMRSLLSGDWTGFQRGGGSAAGAY